MTVDQCCAGEHITTREHNLTLISSTCWIASPPQRGTALLLEHLAGSLASTISVTTHLDIAPQHHLFMKGRNSSNIKHITQRTGAQIHFPDPNGPQKKSTVYIQGTIESVCLARQYLMVRFNVEKCCFFLPFHCHMLFENAPF